MRENLPAVLQRYHPRLIICGDFSGALNDELSAGTVFLGSNKTTVSLSDLDFPIHGRAYHVNTVINAVEKRKKLAKKGF